MRWALAILAQELRKTFAYRVSFWVKFILGTGTELTVAYYLWSAVFAASGQTEIGGYTFYGLLYYTIFATVGAKVIRPIDRGGFIAEDIYQGTLTRYLLYPLPYLGVSYLTWFAQQIIGVAHLFLGLAIATRIWELPPESAISVTSVAVGLLTAFLSGALLFLLNACLELIAFWQDTVWNLMAMLRFISALLGGLMIPISLFPEWGRTAVSFTPFPYVFSFPIRSFLGIVGPEEWFRSAAMVGIWSFALMGLATFIWRRGIRIYSGVGI